MTLRRTLVLTFGSVAALALSYGIAWFVIADQLRTGIDRWVAERRAEGWTAGHGDISIGGFPLTWRARVAAPRLAQSVRRPYFLWAGPFFDLAWRPWQPHVVDFRTAGTHRLGIGTADDGRATPVTMAAAEGRLSLAPDGGVSSLTFRIDEASLPDRNGETLRFASVATAIDARPPGDDLPSKEPHRIPSLRFDTEIAGLVLPAAAKPALGRTIETLGLRGAILGRLPAGNVLEVLSGWRDRGGTLEIERLKLDWSALRVQANGTMALDRELQPVGALTARISGYDRAMDRLVAAGLVKPGEALLAKFALGALARTPGNGGPPEISASISVQEGWIYLGPVKLLPAPRIRWD